MFRHGIEPIVFSLFFSLFKFFSFKKKFEFIKFLICLMFWTSLDVVLVVRDFFFSNDNAAIHEQGNLTLFFLN